MKAASIGLFAIGVLMGTGVTLYYTQSRQEPSLALTEKPTTIPAPSHPAPEIPREPSAPPTTLVPAPRENERVDASIVTIPARHEFDALFKKPNGSGEIHSKLEQQSRDPTWAPATEVAYRSFFQGKPELLRHGTPEVDCRTSLCELRLVAYGADKTTRWSQLLRKPGQFPWPDGGMPLVTNVDEQDGVTAIVMQVLFPERGELN